MEFVFAAHSGMRYLVLLVAALGTVYALIGLLGKRRFDRTGFTIMRASAGVIDLQVLLGIITLLTRAFFPALIGHLVMMIAAAAVAHLGLVRMKKLPEADRRYGLMLASIAVPLALIVGGILALQRAVI